VSQREAVESARSYLEFSAFSRTGLIDQLEFEGFSKKDATVAVDAIDVDWNEQAAKSAENYLEFSAFSRSGLIDQLEFEGFTRSQAEYGVDVAYGSGGSDSEGDSGSGGSAAQQNAVESARSYLEFSAFSRTGLIDQLEFEGFSNSDATFAVDSLDVDWNEQAAKSAKNYLDVSSFSRSELIDQLEFEGFTRSQAEFGVSQAGL
jgi:SOS response regulatory protein OraA/RecX